MGSPSQKLQFKEELTLAITGSLPDKTDPCCARSDMHADNGAEVSGAVGGFGMVGRKRFHHAPAEFVRCRIQIAGRIFRIEFHVSQTLFDILYRERGAYRFAAQLDGAFW